jgi:hypothetical protein
MALKKRTSCWHASFTVNGPFFRAGSWVAKWFVFKPKMPIWVNFGGPCDGRCWYILWPFGLFDGHLAIFYGFLVYVMVIWYIFPVLVSFSKKNLATLAGSRFFPPSFGSIYCSCFSHGVVHILHADPEK